MLEQRSDPWMPQPSKDCCFQFCGKERTKFRGDGGNDIAQLFGSVVNRNGKQFSTFTNIAMQRGIINTFLSLSFSLIQCCSASFSTKTAFQQSMYPFKFLVLIHLRPSFTWIQSAYALRLALTDHQAGAGPRSKEFAAAGLDPDEEAFVVHVASPTSKMSMHPAR